MMKSKSTPVHIVEFNYSSWSPLYWKYRKTTAYVDPSTPNTININTRKLNRSVASVVNTLVHEFVHTVDYTDENHSGIDHGHAGNSNAGKEDTAPYWIGQQAELIINAA